MLSSIGVVGQQRVSGKLEEAFEWRATEGESPVFESLIINLIPSSMEHVEFRVNLQGPPCKAKYL